MRNDTTVRDVMHREFVGVSESDPLAEAAELMLSENADCAVVLRGREPVGRLTPESALAAVLDGLDPAETPVSEAMASPGPTVPADEGLDAAEAQLVAEGSSRLVVTAGGETVGVLSERDVLAATKSSRTNGETQGQGQGVDREAPGVDADASRQVTQSICEVCGSLTSELSASNGQLVCPDCQNV